MSKVTANSPEERAAYLGVYELREATRYFCVTTPVSPGAYPKVYRWVRYNYFTPRGGEPGRRMLTFHDLVTLRMVIALRASGFSLQHIRKVHHLLREITRFSHPFVLADLWVGESEIFTSFQGFLSATKRGQFAMDFLKEWLRHLERPAVGPSDLVFTAHKDWEVASAWIPQSHIILNPLIQFGAPCLEGTRIPTRTIWLMVLGGDQPRAIARDYGVPRDKVESALLWERKLAKAVP
jgi:uncharacterized protein (DUF433 family)/DNA-binding transcriptional MerR regulator